MRNLPLIPLLAAALALAGCQTATWQPGGGTHTSIGGDYTVRVPAAWMFAERPMGFVATNDGVLLQRAGISRHDLTQPLSYSKRTLAPTLTALELAEAVADDMRADHAFLGLEIAELRPAEVGGHAGFTFKMTYHDSSGLHFAERIYGCLTETRLYLLHYTAPARYYFERDAAAFEELVRGFQLTAVGTLPPYQHRVPAAAK